MDIANQIRASQSDKSTTTTLKRSFDVAFLMMPDERLKHKQQPEKFIRVDESPEREPSPKHSLEYLNNNDSESPKSYSIYPQITIRSSKIFDEVTDLSSSSPPMENPKSAFTKVARLESPVPPLSPGQMSCPSISPPISTTPPRTNIYPYQFQQSAQNLQALQNHHRIKQQLMYRHGNPTPSPDHLIQYPGFPFGNGPNPFMQQAEMPGMPRNPAAAAILSTLIPPTLASTFTLTAQNICAKCNISFRMTSDLVYHMRSHHKSEVACDLGRRKREDKLKCPVCNESFRERHHLTRHMTAHQDKESDSQQPESQPLDGHIQSIHQDMTLGRRTK